MAFACWASASLSDKVRQAWRRPSATAHNTRLMLNVCFNYGGRWDIAQAAAKLAAQGEAITPESLDRPWRWPMCPTRTC
jgi:undecaprenyl diphosphate synthase